MDDKYIIAGKVSRSKIVMDIKCRKLKKNDIEKLARNPQIKNTFFGRGFKHKQPKKKWNKAYLDLVLCASVGECFNLEYMLYLDEVADYVVQVKKKKIIIGGITFFVIAVIIAGIIYFSIEKANVSTLNETVGMVVRKAFSKL